MTFENYQVEQWIRKQCHRAYKKGYIDQIALWLGSFHAKKLAIDYVPDITVRWINDEVGYGVFNNQPIKQWEYIGEYAGVLRRRKLLFPDINDYCFLYPREWITFKAFTIDSEKEGNFTRFINHSDTPNIESISVFYDGVFHIMFRAIKDIAPHTELSYDYGEMYWRKRKKATVFTTDSLSTLS